MKNEGLEKDKEMEKLINSKMKELSASVDCFDKISDRVFTGNARDFTEGGYTVNDLEKVTSKRRKHPVLKWTAAAAAVLVIVGILPKTAQVNSLKSERAATNVNLQIYREIVDKVRDIEKDQTGYYVTDLELSVFSRNDILIDPMFTCPFESSDKEGLRVRFYTRMYGNVFTNEVYAVEYSGEYSESNFIAAASSGVSFDENDLSQSKNGKFNDAALPPENTQLPEEFSELIEEYDTRSDRYAGAHFTGSDGNTLKDNDGNTAYLASYAFPSYYKAKSGTVIPLVTGVEYYQLPESEEFCYSTYFITDDYSELELDGKFTNWKNAVYHSGKLSLPKDSARFYKEADTDDDYTDLNRIASIHPPVVQNVPEYETISVYNENGDLAAEADLPLFRFDYVTRNTKIYLPDAIIPDDPQTFITTALLKNKTSTTAADLGISDLHLSSIPQNSD